MPAKPFHWSSGYVSVTLVGTLLLEVEWSIAEVP